MLDMLLINLKYNLIPSMVALDISKDEINKLLDGEGAAGDGGALHAVNDKVTQYGKGIFTITRNGVIFIIAIALVAGAGILALQAGNASKREDEKTATMWRIFAAVLAFGAVSLLAWLGGIATGLF